MPLTMPDSMLAMPLMMAMQMLPMARRTFLICRLEELVVILGGKGRR